MNTSITQRVAVSMLPMLLIACGGGGSGQTTAGIEGTGSTVAVSPAVVAIGAITAFGSIFVNGVEYSLTGSNIQLDGRTSTQSDLKLGQVVTVIASPSASGSTVRAAKSVAAQITVAGRISALDLASNRITILGQRIEVDAATQIVGKISGQPLGGLTVGSDVEVSGFANSAAVLSARSIQPRRTVTPLRVTGRVSNLDSTNRRLQINGQTVNYTGATLTGFSGQALDSATVQVSATTISATGELLATDVAYVDLRVPGTVGDTADLQGWVTRYVSDTDFDVDGHPMTTTSATVTKGVFFGDLSVLRLDVFVHITGKVISNGVVEASEVTTANSVSAGVAIDSISATNMAAPMWFYSPCTLADTAFSVDGVPAIWQDIQPGDKANIQSSFNVPPDSILPKQQKCYVVDVEHSVVGRIESLDPVAAALVVNGQRIWMSPDMFLFGQRGSEWGVSGVGTAAEARAALRVGARVAVSGDLTVEGDFVALGINSAAASPGYRVTGFARDVDTVSRILRLGSLQVDYSSASLSGFTNGGPAAGDRIVVIATDPPAGGLQTATGLKYAAGAQRGEKLNFVTLKGLLTGSSGVDWAIDGRMTAVLPNAPTPGNGLERNVCDPAKLHLNLRTQLVAVGGINDARPMRLFHVCPQGRRNDAYEAVPGGSSSAQIISVTAGIQSVDIANYLVRVAGSVINLNPGSTLTSARLDGSLTRTTPLRVQDLRVGDRVRIDLPLTGGPALADALWTGPAAVTGTEDSVSGLLQGVSDPNLTTGPITVHTAAGTTFNISYYDSNCQSVTGTKAELWNGGSKWNATTDTSYSLFAKGSVTGSALEATAVEISPRTSPCNVAGDY
jgi:hypothetical protein